MVEIKELREKYGLTRKAFCDLLQIPKRTVEDWEYGKRRCPEYVLKLIQHYFETKDKA